MWLGTGAMYGILFNGLLATSTEHPSMVHASAAPGTSHPTGSCTSQPDTGSSGRVVLIVSGCFTLTR